MRYYAVRKGRIPGVYKYWCECEAQVKGFPGCDYRAFKTEEEANAYVNNTHAIAIPEKRDMSNFFNYFLTK